MEISVVVAAREEPDRRLEEPLEVATLADRLGYREVWIGEGPTWDAFALATAIGMAAETIALTVGPVPVSVRDPATIARAAASVAALTGRPTGVALGTSSTRVVEGFHGRSRRHAATRLSETAEAVRALMKSSDPPPSGELLGFQQRLGPPGGRLTVAAFGDRAIATAVAHADRLVLDLVSPDQVEEIHSRVAVTAKRLDRRPPVLAAWLPCAVDPDERGVAQVLHTIAGYLSVGGYAEMFESAGFGDAVATARSGKADLDELVRMLPPEAAGVVGLVGTTDHVDRQLEEYSKAGLDEVAIVPMTAGDPEGRRTLTALR